MSEETSRNATRVHWTQNTHAEMLGFVLLKAEKLSSQLETRGSSLGTASDGTVARTASSALLAYNYSLPSAREREELDLTGALDRLIATYVN
ncbi:hypothetical protein M231_04794 [Tremella mesenterica]|uniref:Uncharacterized protein n=1 Tax=Tremella mesenterica TaxID=5217 RepID=A0A4Q1BJR5_TREME|nr:hypothetical protein M231_04794 [Tremella mesenterica]